MPKRVPIDPEQHKKLVAIKGDYTININTLIYGALQFALPKAEHAIHDLPIVPRQDDTWSRWPIDDDQHESIVKLQSTVFRIDRYMWVYVLLAYALSRRQQWIVAVPSS